MFLKQTMQKIKNQMIRNYLFIFFTYLLPFSTGFCSLQKALIFGVGGQDGHYLAQFLIEKGYEVHGVMHAISSIEDHDFPKNEHFFVHPGNLLDTASILCLIDKIRPNEIYNLAAQSSVSKSFEIPEYTAEVNALGTLRILEAIKQLDLISKVKFYQASTSELYGITKEIPQTEKTPFHPCSPYATSKLFGYWITINYRESYKLFACNGILFNHESPYRNQSFVSRKITHAVSQIAAGKQKSFSLGNLDAKRDWGYAKDYVEAMWLILQQEEPEDFVIATGEIHSVREFVECAFKEVGIHIEWEGQGINEVGLDKKTKNMLVYVNPIYFRPNEVSPSLGDAKRAQDQLNWKPKTSFTELVKIMMQSDIKFSEKENIYPK